MPKSRPAEPAAADGGRIPSSGTGSPAGRTGLTGASRLGLGVLAGRGVGGQRGDEGLRRDLDPADVLHPLLALLLLLQELALTGAVTAVALGQHVLAQCAEDRKSTRLNSSHV